MSQRNVELLLGKILTDDGFRESFLPVGPRSFELAASLGLEFTPVERSALSTASASGPSSPLTDGISTSCAVSAAPSRSRSRPGFTRLA